MIAYLFKPFGADNWLVLTEPDEVNELFDKLVPGDQFIIRCIEMSDDDYKGLSGFDGFSGPQEIEGNEENNEEEEEPPQPSNKAEILSKKELKPIKLIPNEKE